jgi:hypothetical protein
MKVCSYFCAYLAKYLSERKMFRTEVVSKNETYIMSNAPVTVVEITKQSCKPIEKLYPCFSKLKKITTFQYRVSAEVPPDDDP